MIRFIGITLLAVGLGAQVQDSLPPNGISARIEAAVTDAGALRATFTVTASGPASLTYRDAYMATDVPMPSLALFGIFIQNRKFRSTPVVNHAIDADRPIEIQLQILEDDYFLPVQRQATAQFNLLPSLAVPVESEGKLQLGEPGFRREEIVFEIPANFVTLAETHQEETQDFAHYRSDAIVDSGKLHIVRDLEIRQSEVSSTNRAAVEALWKVVRDDQQRTFVFRRVARTDLTAWIASVPANRANSLGFRAQQQREYDAARQLFEKATAAYPNDRFAWNNLGRALAALGRLEDAQTAYRRQLTINPADQYAYNNIGVVQERLGNWSKAIDSLRKQLEVHPGDSFAISNLPRALIHEKRWAEAEDAASHAAALQPSNLTHRLYLAIARVCDGTAPDVRTEIDTALGSRPSSASLNNAAYYLAECGKEAALAEGYIRRALELVNRSEATALRGTMSAALAHQNTLSTHLDTYGWLLFKGGQIERALKLFEASVALAPRADVYAHLAEAEAKSGRNEQAVIHWREATFLEPEILPRVPPGDVDRLKSIRPSSLDRGWYPMNANLPVASLESLRPGQACYFFAIAGPDGAVQSIRELDAGDPVAKQMLPAVRALTFAAVQPEASPLSTVHILRVTKGNDGPLVARSVSTEAVAIASELAPGEFPLPVPAAPPPSDTTVYRVGNGVAPPRVLSKLEPAYSEEARRAHLTGTVALSGVVGQDGQIRDLKVTNSLGLGLDENAIQAAMAWRFEPGSKDGQPVNVMATINVNFRLSFRPPETAWHSARVEFHIPPAASRPRFEKVTPLPSSRTLGNATATLTFEVDQQGAPVSIQIEKASDDDWARDVAAVVGKWKFTPGHANSIPVSVPCVMDLVADN